jgi:hypothetical protein
VHSIETLRLRGFHWQVKYTVTVTQLTRADPRLAVSKKREKGSSGGAEALLLRVRCRRGKCDTVPIPNLPIGPASQPDPDLIVATRV